MVEAECARQRHSVHLENPNAYPQLGILADTSPCQISQHSQGLSIPCQLDHRSKSELCTKSPRSKSSHGLVFTGIQG